MIAYDVSPGFEATAVAIYVKDHPIFHRYSVVRAGVLLAPPLDDSAVSRRVFASMFGARVFPWVIAVQIATQATTFIVDTKDREHRHPKLGALKGSIPGVW
jgi:hypothetical protein